jgi:hypothetical protein
MVELIDYIDTQIKNCITEAKQFGLCRLVEDTNDKYPATVERQATKAAPDDRFDVLMYHRALGGSPDERPDLSFGKYPVRQNQQRVRTVVFVKMGNDNRIDDIINAYPQTWKTTNYYNAFVGDGMTLIRDSNAIWNEEFSEAYRDRYQAKWLIYAIEFDIFYIKCSVCV